MTQSRKLTGTVILVIGIVIGAVAVYAVILRPLHMRWGTTAAEREISMPFDADAKSGREVSTRAITIDAPMKRVWPWLVQLGQGRGGFYSYHWLENQFAAEMVNADEILPQFQDTAPGTKIPLMKNGPVDHTVSLIEAPQSLMLDDGWFMLLEPIDGNTTRLVVRYALDPGAGLLERYYYYAIFEPAHFVMEAGMMIGIKVRAERMDGKEG